MKWRGGYLVYGLPALALAVPTLPAHVLLPTFYASDLGLGLAATGIAILVARLVDVASDPLIGYFSDRLGRRKPFIGFGALLAAVALVAVFAPPSGVGPVYLGFWYALLYVGWSLVMVPYTAWGAELSGDYATRLRISSWREGMGLIGIAIAATVPAALQQVGWSTASAMQATALVAILAGMPALFLLLRLVPEVRIWSPGAATGWRIGILAVRGNGPFRRLLVAWFINGVANGLPAALFPLFVMSRLGADGQTLGLFLLAYFAAALASLPAWLWLLRCVDKHRLWCIAMAGAILAFLPVPLLQAGDIAGFAAICVVTGFALGADLALPPALQADVVDIDRLVHGAERAGLYFAVSSVSGKLSAALAVGVAFPLLAVLGFEPGDTPAPGGETVKAGFALAVIYSWVPCVFKTIAVACMWNFPIDRQRQEGIRLQIGRGN